MRTRGCVATVKIFAFVGMLIASATFAIGGPATYVGNQTVGAISDGSSNCMDGSWYKAGSNMSLTSLTAYFQQAGTGAIQFAVYSDSGGVPSTLLGTTVARSNTGTGWQTFNLNKSIPVTSGAKYWFLWNAAASGYKVASTTATGGSDEWYKRQAYGTWTTSAGTGSISPGFCYSIYATAADGGTVSTVATPTISPNGGSFTGTQPVTLSCTTTGASIYYTTNGSTPTNGSTLYTSAFNVTQTSTVKAIALASGGTQSSVASATIAISIPTSYIGNKTVGAISDGGFNCMDGSWYTAGSNMTLTSMTAYFKQAGTGAIQFAIYSDSNGVPSALLGTTVARSNTGTGWQTFNLNKSIPVTSGAKYWFLWNTAVSGYKVASTTATGGSDEWYKRQTYGTWTSSAGIGSKSPGFCYSIYATASGSTVTPTITSVTISPSASTLNTGSKKQFAATVTGTGSYSSGITWSAQRGTITSAGLYTAPSSSGSDVVTAASLQNSSKTATANVTVTTVLPTITSLSVNPTSCTMNTGVQKQLTATITGTGSYSSGIAWSAQRGNVTSLGLYTSPSTSGSDVVTATSLQDSSKSVTTSVTVNSNSSTPIGALAAFPGAEGFGAGATGGRGGVVYTVNSLSDVYSEGTKYPTPNNGADGPTCTLRDALQASGPRTIVFSVSGTITLRGPIYPIPGNLTIAGQTSPGGGIQVRGDGSFGTGGAMIHLTGNNVVIRYLKIRPGTAPLNGSDQGLAGIVQGAKILEDHIIDHCSFEWDGAKPWAYGLSKRITLSWNLMGESMMPHSTGPLINAGTTDQTNLNLSSFDGHHNIMARIDHRLPYSHSKYFRWVNNLVFGYNYAGLVRGNVHADIIGNVFDGISSRIADNSSRQEFRWADTYAHNENQAVPGGDKAQFFMSNNFGPHNTDGTADNFSTMLRIASNENGQLNNNPVDSQYKVSGPTSMPSSLNTHPITVMHLSTYSDLRSILAASAGASRRLAPDGSWVANRDSADSNIISYILNPSTSPTGYAYSPGTYPTLAAGTPPSDSDGDGMPDIWEDAHGLNKNLASDRNTIRSNASGYTNLELYLSGFFPNGTPLP